MKPYRVTQHIGQGPEQGELDFGAFPKNPFTEGTQSHRVFEYLRLHKAVTTKQLHNELKVDCARVRSDVRPYLRKNGLDYTVKPIPGDPGNRLYKVI
jgi:transposase